MTTTRGTGDRDMLEAVLFTVGFWAICLLITMLMREE
jgi:hypothetical protein